MGKAEGKCGGWTGKQAGIACEAKVGVCRVGGSGELGKRRRDGCRGRRRKGPCQQRRAPGPPLELWLETPRPHAFLMETWSCLAWSCLGAGMEPARFDRPACGTEPHRCQAPIFLLVHLLVMYEWTTTRECAAGMPHRQHARQASWLLHLGVTVPCVPPSVVPAWGDRVAVGCVTHRAQKVLGGTQFPAKNTQVVHPGSGIIQ